MTSGTPFGVPMTKGSRMEILWKIMMSLLFGGLGTLVTFLTYRVGEAHGRAVPGKRTWLIPFFISGGLGFLFGPGIPTLISFILVPACLMASAQDLKEHRMDDCFTVIVLSLSLSRLHDLGLSGILSGLATGFCVMLAARWLTGKGGRSLGGADLKFAAALCALLGPLWGLGGLFAGTLAAVLIEGRKARKNPGTGKVGFPMIPYLSAGFGLAFVLSTVLHVFLA